MIVHYLRIISEQLIAITYCQQLVYTQKSHNKIATTFAISSLAKFGKVWQSLAEFNKLWQPLANLRKLAQTCANLRNLWQTCATTLDIIWNKNQLSK